MQASQVTKVPNRIRELREAKAFSRADLASALGVIESTVWRWERGESAPPDHHKLTLAAMFDVDPGYLMGWSDVRRAA
jgi:transcriptional regulator with XRE-family HTH domain